MLPKISVLMPARNSASTIKLAVQSTLFALNADDELVVGLHDCVDKTEEILKSIDDCRLKVVEISGATLGVALNNMLPFASKDFIGRMDADDICLPWRFFIQKRYLKSFDFVFTTALIWYPRIFPMVAFPQYPTTITTNLIAKLMAHTNPLVHPTMVARKVELEALKYRAIEGEDLDLWLRAILSGKKFIRIGIPSVIYRIHDRQLSKNPEYLSGWKHSSEINRMRILCASREIQSSFGIKGFLELLGFPTVSKAKSVFELISSKRTSRSEENL